MTPIYFDYHATTPVLPEVANAMAPYYSEHFGNPASQHSWGWKANLAVSKARNQVAKLFNGPSENFLFTSGATESIHLAILGWLLAQKDTSQCQIITSSIEHKATLGACKIAGKMGAEIFIAPVDRLGHVDQKAILQKINPQKSVLVSVIHGHNEIGTLNHIETLAQQLHGRALLHVDAAQSAGKITIDLTKTPIDMMSFSGHKMYGPKGVGALYVRDPKLIHSLFSGGGQEFNLRAGTLNVPGIVGLGHACEWSKTHGDQESLRLQTLRDLFFNLVEHPRVTINGDRTHRLPHNINICVSGVNPDQMSDELEGMAFSSGSACSSSAKEPNHVHQGIGLSEEASRTTFRFGLGVHTTEDHVRLLAKKITTLIAKG